MMEMMKNMDFNKDKVNRQFAELGVKPEDVITKVMANPELAAGFANPKVQAAILDISSNPMNIVKYQTDPEVMAVRIWEGGVRWAENRQRPTLWFLRCFSLRSEREAGEKSVSSSSSCRAGARKTAGWQYPWLSRVACA